MPLRIGIFGRGRLGSAIAAAAVQTDDLEVAWQVGRGSHEDLAAVQVAVDVSHADAVPQHLDWARRTGTALVIGTTGWDRALLGAAGPPDVTKDRADGLMSRPPSAHDPEGSGDDGIGILTAPNFSLSVALMRRLAGVIGRYAGRSAEPADVAVSETHHARKVDAPSGTAVLLRDALAEGAGRHPDAVQTTSLRLGAVVGRHEVHYESPVESLTVSHEAHTRDVFALGALTAVRWLHGRAGTHTFDDLAAEVLDPLFTPHPHQEEEP